MIGLRLGGLEDRHRPPHVFGHPLRLSLRIDERNRDLGLKDYLALAPDALRDLEPRSADFDELRFDLERVSENRRPSAPPRSRSCL
jgi:hypothetical protein